MGDGATEIEQKLGLLRLSQYESLIKNLGPVRAQQRLSVEHVQGECRLCAREKSWTGPMCLRLVLDGLNLVYHNPHVKRWSFVPS